MTEAVITPVEQPSYLDMSDEDIMNAAPPTIAPTEPVVTQAKPDAVQTSDEVVAPVEAVADAEDDEDQGDQDPEGSAAADDAALAAAKASKEAEGIAPKEVTKETKPPVTTDESPEKKPVDAPVVNFEAEYKRLLAPFKANGRDITVNSVDEAKTLMQMGANYNKKMAGLKPNLKLMKLLDNNGLLSEEKISFLIDLDKKNPDAINKLVKDSGINPMDFDAEKVSEYKPKIHTVDEREIELDTVLDDIQSTPTYNRTLSIVSKEWDGASKQVIAGSPQLLKVINSHVESGIYDLISKEVESGRMLGRLDGLSDIEAYRQVGDAIQARGGFNHLGSFQGKTDQRPVIVAPNPKKVDDAKLNEKRRAASSTKPAVSGSVAKGFNPLELSDEEFSKLSVDKFR